MTTLSRATADHRTDIDYYLHKQILPPVERLCAPISGTNVTRLAECLGLDTSKYRVSTVAGGANSSEQEIHPLESQIPDAVRFKDALPLSLRCLRCHKSSPFRGIAETPASVTNDGIACADPSCKASLTNFAVVAQLEAQIKQHLAQYYSGWLVCDDPACGQRTRQMSVYGHRCLGPRGLGQGCLGRMSYEYTEKQLYNQLLYFQTIFDVDKARKKAKEIGVEIKAEEDESSEKVGVLAEVNRERFATLTGVVKGYLGKNGRQWVQMDSLFAFALKAM
jgi:DNA polymerase alpha subunit A